MGNGIGRTVPDRPMGGQEKAAAQLPATFEGFVSQHPEQFFGLGVPAVLNVLRNIRL